MLFADEKNHAEVHRRLEQNLAEVNKSDGPHILHARRAEDKIVFLEQRLADAVRTTVTEKDALKSRDFARSRT